jgi:hypothetical protein
MSQTTVAGASNQNPLSAWGNPREWVWVRVLFSAAFGLRPGRIGLAFFALVIAMVLLSVGMMIDNEIMGERIGVVLIPLGPETDWTRLPWHLFVELPVALVRHWPVTTLVFGPLVLAAWSIMLGAIARIAACEIALSRHISWWEGLAFALRSWVSLIGAVLGPIVLVWLICLLLAAAGFLLLRWPGVNILGAVLYGVFLLIGFAAAGLAIIYIVGQHLLIPAVVCDGADAIDAVQRAYAYVIDRPLRLVLYVVLALIGLVVVIAIVTVFIGAAVYLTAQATSFWAGAEGSRMVWRGVLEGFGVAAVIDAGETEGTYRAGATIIRFWTVIPLLLIWAAWVSCATAAATMIYLAIRRACDGQDISEIWWPGKVEEAMDASMAARAKAAGAAPPAVGGIDADYQ